MAIDKGNLVMSSTDSILYFDGEELFELSKAEAKATKESEDVIFVGDPKTYKRSKGYKIEGSLTVKKVNSNIALKVANAMKKGENMDAKIIAKQARVDGKTERIALTGVDISELPLFSMEGNNLVEQEFPFTATDFEFLDTIK